MPVDIEIYVYKSMVCPNISFSPVPFPVASFIASSASANVEAELFFLFFISLPQLMMMKIIQSYKNVLTVLTSR